MIAFNDSLYIFTKNWGNYQSNVYKVSNIPGTYSLSKIDSLNIQGSFTGATYDSTNQVLVLCGYQTSAFTYRINGVIPSNFSSGTSVKTTLAVQNSFQVEGITLIENQFYISSEQNILGASSLYRFQSESNLALEGKAKQKGLF